MLSYLKSIRNALNKISNHLSVEDRERLAVQFSSINNDLYNMESTMKDLNVYVITYKLKREEFGSETTKVIASSILSAVDVVTRHRPYCEILKIDNIGKCVM